MSGAIEAFREAIAAAGLTPPDTIHDDGLIHRFSTNGRRGDDSGWYVYHGDDIPAGAFGCWRSGLQSTWCAKSDKAMTAAEREAHRQRIKAMRAQRDAEQAQRQQSASATAAAMWQQGDPATAHPYLTTKAIQPHGIKSFGDKLLIPMRDTAGTLHSLQTIAPDGSKLFHPGGRVKGCYFGIGKPADKLIVCEGFATGASLHEATGDAVAVAFNAGNLEAVALALRDKYPALKIVIAADDDHLTDGNPGMTKAMAAAQAVGGDLIKPEFGADRPDKATDFNDLHQIAGLGAVRDCIEEAANCSKLQRGQTDPSLEEDAADNDAADNHRNAPKPDPACLYGLIGDVARAGGDTTEANPFAIAANMIAFMSVAVGRGAYMPVGNTWHHARLFTLHIGRSGRGRKGDAVSLVSRIAYAVQAANEFAAPQIHRGGLSSREGLVFLIHDGFKEGKNEVEPILDKRLWVVESEFANVLHQGKREGNTLSAALRDCWDGVSLKPATKSNRLHATDPHVGLSGAVTPGELLGLMASRELTNGFANRFLMFWAERTKIVAFPVATSQSTVEALAERVLTVIDFCKAERWAEKDHTRIDLAPDARALYDRLYRRELNDTSSGERITALIERRAPMLLRLAMLFALCDLTTTVEVHHINAALAWVRYSVESVKFIFASAADEAEVAQTNDTAQKIADFLAVHGEATRSQLTRNCFQGHTPKSRIDAALDELLRATPPVISVESVPRPKGLPGSETKTYRLSGAKSAKSANSEQSREFAGDSDDCEVCEVCEASDSEVPTVRTVRTVREPENQAETRASIDTSHSSHSSQQVTENPPEAEDAEVF